MKPIFTLEYFCCFFTETWCGSSDAQKDEAEEKEVEKEKHAGARQAGDQKWKSMKSDRRSEGASLPQYEGYL